jgi:hypothetical protein
MADQDISVTLRSRADTSGYQQTAQAVRGLNAAKYDATKQNATFVDSERRLRTNLIDTVSGLASAKNGTDAAAVAMTHLSEVFKLSADAVIALGIGGIIVSEFGKAQQAIEELGKSLGVLGEQLSDFLDKAHGVEPSAQQTAQREVKHLAEQVQEKENQLKHPGFFGGAAIGAAVIGNALGLGGEGTVEDIKKNVEQLQQLKSQLAQAQAYANNPANFAKLGAKELKGEQAHVTEESARQEIEQERADEEHAKQVYDARQKARADATRQAEEERRKAGSVDREKAKQDARQSRDESRAESRSDSAAGREEVKIIAGHQREIGGGGRAYSVVVDPAVEEARKHTTLLQDIASTLKSGLKPQTVPAAHYA